MISESEIVDETPSELFRALLDDSSVTERQIHLFLKKYPYVLIHLFNDAWNFYHIWSEFKLGTDFRADFAILNAHSGGWNVHFIELEGPNDKPYTNDGLPTRKLNWAIRQTNDWRDFVSRNKSGLVSEFSKLVKPLRAIAQNNLMGKTTADVELEHPRTWIDFDYHVVIGRSTHFNERQLEGHRHYHHSHGAISYDRVFCAMQDFESRFEGLTDKHKALSRIGKSDR